MTSQIEIVDVDGLAAGGPRPGVDGAGCRYLSALVRAGARHFVDNADVAVKLLVVDGTTLPLVVAEGRHGNSEVCSPHAHYVRYVPQARAKRHPAIPAACFEALALPMGLVSRIGRFDDVVYVNNWLWSTNPKPGLSAAQIAAVTARLVAAYARAAIVFRSVNPALDAPTFDALRAHGYRLIRSREISLLDTASGAHLAHQNTRRDLALLAGTRYEIVRAPADLAPHAARIAALYRDLYLDKYPSLNAQFNTRFFELTLATGVLRYAALRADGRLDAFAAYFVEDDVVTSALIGHDRRVPRERGLYRMAMALLMTAAAERGLALNLSSGAASFKRLRGARPVPEFDAVYDAHLPAHRRLAWTALALAANRHGGPERRATIH